MEFTIAQAVIALLLVGVVGSLGSRVILEARDDVLDGFDRDDDLGFRPYEPRLTPSEDVVVDNVIYFKEGVELYHRLTKALEEPMLMDSEMVMPIEGASVYSIMELIELASEYYDEDHNDDYIYLSNACNDYLKNKNPTFRLSFDNLDSVETKNEIVPSYFCGVVQIDDQEEFPDTINYEGGEFLIDRSHFSFSNHYLSLNSDKISHHFSTRAGLDVDHTEESRINLLFQLQSESEDEVTHILIPFGDSDLEDCIPDRASRGASRNPQDYVGTNPFQECLSQENNYSFYYLDDSDLDYKVSPLVYEWRERLPDNRYTIPYFFLPQTCYHSRYDSECPTSDDGTFKNAIEYLKVEDKYPDYIFFYHSFPQNEDHYWRMNMTDSLLVAMTFNALRTSLLEFISPTSAGFFGSVKQDLFGRSVINIKGNSLLTSIGASAANIGTRALDSDAFIYSLYYLRGFEYERGVNIQEFFEYDHSRDDLILASPGNVRTASFDATLPLFLQKDSDDIDTYQNFHLVSPCLSNLDLNFKEIDYQIGSDFVYFNDGVLSLSNRLEDEIDNPNSLDCDKINIFDNFYSLDEESKENMFPLLIEKVTGGSFDLLFDYLYHDQSSFNKDQIYDFYDKIYSECKNDDYCDFLLDLYNVDQIVEETLFKFFTNVQNIDIYDNETEDVMLFNLFPNLDFEIWESYNWGSSYFDSFFLTSHNIPSFLIPLGLMYKYNINSLEEAVERSISEYRNKFNRAEGNCDNIISLINESFYYEFYYDRFSNESYYELIYGEDYLIDVYDSFSPDDWLSGYNLDNNLNEDFVCSNEIINFLDEKMNEIEHRLNSDKCDFMSDNFGNNFNLNPGREINDLILMPNHYCVEKIHKLDNILSTAFLPYFVENIYYNEFPSVRLNENFFYDLIYPTLYIDNDRVNDIDSYLRPISFFFSFLYDDSNDYLDNFGEGNINYIDDIISSGIDKSIDEYMDNLDISNYHKDTYFIFSNQFNNIAIGDNHYDFTLNSFYNFFLYDFEKYNSKFYVGSDNFLYDFIYDFFGYYYNCSDNSIINDVSGNYEIASNDMIKENQLFDSLDLDNNVFNNLFFSISESKEQRYFDNFYGEVFTTKNNILVSPDVLNGFCYGNAQNLHRQRRNNLIALAVLQYPLRWGIVGGLTKTGIGAPLGRLADAGMSAGLSAFTTYGAYRTMNHNRWPQGPHD